MTLLAEIDTIEKQRYRNLWSMLSTMRPAGSEAEENFIDKYIMPLGVDTDAVGNLIKRVGVSPVMWSSHTDTVHAKSGSQIIKYKDGMILLAKGSKSACLGADCTVGVWLMVEMIKANVPGLYIFHRGEEIGGVGSTYIAHKTPELMDGIKCAIAFDRMDYDSVITHQQMGRCCSDIFANSLADAIGLEMRTDPTGSFTDTANYTDLIGECTNVSVGYFNQHSSKEHQDVDFLANLLNAMLKFNSDDLMYSRKAGEIDPDAKWAMWGGYGGWSADGYEYEPPSTDMADLITDNPSEIASILRNCGYNEASLADELWELGGAVPSSAFK